MEIKGLKETLKRLKNLQNAIPLALKETVAEIATVGQETAQKTLLNTDHTQKYGDELVNEIGVMVLGNKARVYTPITKTKEMKAQMQYAEFGAGIASKENKESGQYFKAPPQSAKAMAGKKWYYYTTPADKNPNQAVPSRYVYGKFVNSTNTSKPARFMYTARRKMQSVATTILARNIEKRI